MTKSKAFIIFGMTLKRSMGMLGLASSFEDLLKDGKIKESDYLKTSDIARASIVISVSAMDSYFTRKFVEILIPFIKNNGASKGIVEVLEKAGLDTFLALELLTMARPYRRIRTLVDNYLERVVTQKFEVIDNLFLCFGIKNFCENVQKMSGKKRTLRSLELLIERRHKIVHEGDVDSRGRLRPLQSSLIEKRIKELARFVFFSEKLINQRTKST